MITAVSLNPSIDRLISVDSLNVGGLNRVKPIRTYAGGKGLNVALTVSQLGLDAECIGFMQTETSRIFENRLIANGTQYDFVYCDGSTRTNVKLFDGASGLMTELNENGLPVAPEQVRAMTELIFRHAERADYLVLSGSMPPGCPADYYRELIAAMDGLGCRCILDADGERLREGVKAKPYMIKPNRFELETITGRKLETLKDIRDAALTYIDQGVSVVAVSLGDQGALITDGRESLYAPKLEVEVKSTVGAGDAMVAGLASGFIGEYELAHAFKIGVACATAACMSDGSKMLERADYRVMLERVRIESI